MASLYEDLPEDTESKKPEEALEVKEPKNEEVKAEAASTENDSHKEGAAESNGDGEKKESSEQPAAAPVAPVEEEKAPLVFVGGLSYKTTEAGLRMYFETFGEVRHIDFKRGFAFVHFASKEGVDKCCSETGPHTIDGKTVDVKVSDPSSAPKNQVNNTIRTAGYGQQQQAGQSNSNSADSSSQGGVAAAGSSNESSTESSKFGTSSSRDDDDTTGKKVFVGGLAQDVRAPDLKEFMSQYGTIDDAVVMLDHATGRSRGFGFVTFATTTDAQSASKLGRVFFNGKPCEVKMYDRGGSGPSGGRGRGGYGGGGGFRGGGAAGYQHQGSNSWNSHRPGGGDRSGSGGYGGGRSSYYGGLPQSSSYGAAAAPPYAAQQSYYGASAAPAYYGQPSATGYGAPDYSQQQQQQQWGQYDYAAWQAYYAQQGQAAPVDPSRAPQAAYGSQAMPSQQQQQYQQPPQSRGGADSRQDYGGYGRRT